MRPIIKDENFLSCLWVVGKIQPRQRTATLIIKGTFKLHHDQIALPTEDQPDSVVGDTYFGDDDCRSILYPSDFVPFKARTDLILNMTAYSPDGVPKPHITVGVGFGQYGKQLDVFGNRQWLEETAGKSPGKPQPFIKMPITYEYAFGGTGYSSNPIGKGRDTILMPNIEFPKYRLTSPGDNLPPASFGALHPDWAQRMALVGSYGENYVKEIWPSFPADFDWSFFHSAPKDQQLKGYVKGDEPLVFYNLHPEFPEYRSALPGLRVRCFVEEVAANNQPGEFREVSMNLDTVWIDMDAEKLVLVWRGLTPALSPKLKEFQSVFALAEPLSEPAHDLSHYRMLMQRTITEEEAEFEIEERPTEDVDALIEKEMATFDAEIAQVEKEFAEL
ncbi:MAG: DUF2169 domain-containing protein, partial [Gammaproteobacteria bacterium]|nr:DUF2169 domain-containing protein [Gammaproteobacteria bacterium]